MAKDMEMQDMPVVDNVGIMQGFFDMMNDDDDDLEDMDERETGEILGRTPDSPEILMNNLRGDMRSIDARREELADLVGYSAAAETPEPVLAMLQPVLAQQGIGPMMPGMMSGMMPGGAPAGPPMAPPMPAEMMAPPTPVPPGGIGDMAPGMMPPGPPPGLPPGMPPLQMARGGIVQRFSKGSTPAAVTSADEAASDEGDLVFEPSIERSSNQLINQLFAQRPEAVPGLGARAGELSREYANLFGSSKDRYAGQAAFDLAALAFAYAGNVDPVTGKPMRGSPFARFAQAARAAPGVLSKYAAESAKEDRELKLLGLKGAQSEREAVLERNARLLEEKRRAALEVTKAAAKRAGTSRFSKGDFGYEILTTPGLISDWAVGKTGADQNMLIEAGLTDLLKPITEDIVDPKNNTVIIGRRIRPGTMMPFVKDAMTQWGDRQGMSYDDVIKLFTDPNFRMQRKAAVGQPVSTGAAPTRDWLYGDQTPTKTTNLADLTTVEKGEDVLIGDNFSRLSSNLPGDVAVRRLMEQGLLKREPEGLFWQFGKVAGPASGLANIITSIPGLGDPYAAVSTARTEALIAQENLISAFLKSANKGEQEQRRVEARYKLSPDSFEDPYKLRNRLVSFDQEISKSIEELQAISKDETLAREQRRDADERIASLLSIKRKLNVPIVVNTQEEVRALPAGTIFLWKGTQLNVRKETARGR